MEMYSHNHSISKSIMLNSFLLLLSYFCFNTYQFYKLITINPVKIRYPDLTGLPVQALPDLPE